MKKRFTEEQILDFLKQAEAGVPVKERTATTLDNRVFNTIDRLLP